MSAERVAGEGSAQIGAVPEEVALVRDTTEGNSVVINGLDFRTDDDIVILGTESRRVSGRPTASQIASASAASFSWLST